MAGAKKFAPSNRKLKKAREDGDVAKSRMLTAAAALTACSCWVCLDRSAISQLQNLIIRCLSASEDFHTNTMLVSLDEVWHLLARLLLPSIAAAALGALVAELLQVGVVVSWKSLTFRWSRLSFVAGFKRLLGVRTSESEGVNLGMLSEFAKLSGAMAILVMVWSYCFWGVFALVPATDFAEAVDVWRAIILVVRSSVVPVIVSIGLLGVMGFLSARKKRLERLQMDFQELKQELHESEGNPEIRSLRKQLHRELSLHSIVEGVRKAQVVVVNREH